MRSFKRYVVREFFKTILSWYSAWFELLVLTPIAIMVSPTSEEIKKSTEK